MLQNPFKSVTTDHSSGSNFSSAR